MCKDPNCSHFSPPENVNDSGKQHAVYPIDANEHEANDRVISPLEGEMSRSDRGGYRNKSRNWSGPFPKTPCRLLGMGFIRLYQLTLSGFIGNSCRHIPTCSEYGYEAVARHGLWPGFWMALFRFARCGPGGTSGLDPVVETLPERNKWYLVWRYWRLR